MTKFIGGPLDGQTKQLMGAFHGEDWRELNGIKFSHGIYLLTKIPKSPEEQKEMLWYVQKEKSA